MKQLRRAQPRYKELFDEEGLDALRDEGRKGKPNFKNRIAPETEQRMI